MGIGPASLEFRVEQRSIRQMGLWKSEGVQAELFRTLRHLPTIARSNEFACERAEGSIVLALLQEVAGVSGRSSREFFGRRGLGTECAGGGGGAWGALPVARALAKFP
jgi:hypothetical protein